MTLDMNKIAQGTQMIKTKRIVKYEWDDGLPKDDIDLEELAKSYNDKNQKPNKKNILDTVKKKVIVYVDDKEFFDLRWAEFEVVDIYNLRQDIDIEVGDKFVWDKHLVRWIGEISNVDKIWQTEEIYDVNNEFVNDVAFSKFKLYFNPLTYQKCEWNTNSKN